MLLKSSISNPGIPEDLSNRLQKLMRFIIDFVFEAFSYEENTDKTADDFFMGEK